MFACVYANFLTSAPNGTERLSTEMEKKRKMSHSLAISIISSGKYDVFDYFLPLAQLGKSAARVTIYFTNFTYCWAMHSYFLHCLLDQTFWLKSSTIGYFVAADYYNLNLTSPPPDQTKNKWYALKNSQLSCEAYIVCKIFKTIRMGL